MDTGDNDFLDLVKTATLPSVAVQIANTAFGALQGDLDVPYGSRGCSACAEFCWQGKTNAIPSAAAVG
jgi:hypothetical protein